MSRFHRSRNTFVFTVLFLAISVVAGLVLTILLDQSVFGRRSSGTSFLPRTFLHRHGHSWRWVFNPETGINLLLDSLGLNWLLNAGIARVLAAMADDSRRRR